MNDSCEGIPAEVLQTLGTRWLESFESAARAENRKGIMLLFDPGCLICGSYKGGPLDRIMSKNFHFEISTAKMLPHSPTILIVVQWHAVSLVHGGPTRKGDATLYCGCETDGESKRFICYHAHFSEIPR